MTRVLVTGASGQLGPYLLRELQQRGLPALGWSGHFQGELFGAPIEAVPLDSPTAILEAFERVLPTLVLHAGALSRIADCQRDPARAFAINSNAVATLAALTRFYQSRLVHLSTDLVFDGEKGNYCEADALNPLSIYGKSKAEGEQAILRWTRGVVVRVSLMVGPHLLGCPSFFGDQLDRLRNGHPLTLFTDEWRTPLSFATAARALVEIGLSDFSGLLHLGGPERLSRYEMGQQLATHLGANPALLVPTRRADAPAPEPRPRDTSLNSARWRDLFPSLPWPTFTDFLREMELE